MKRTAEDKLRVTTYMAGGGGLTAGLGYSLLYQRGKGFDAFFNTLAFFVGSGYLLSALYLQVTTDPWW